MSRVQNSRQRGNLNLSNFTWFEVWASLSIHVNYIDHNKIAFMASQIFSLISRNAWIDAAHYVFHVINYK